MLLSSNLREISRTFAGFSFLFLLTGCFLNAHIVGNKIASVHSNPLVPTSGPLKIIRTTPDGSAPLGYAVDNNQLFFLASIPGNSRASYLTNASSSGTNIVTSINTLLPADSEFRGSNAGVRYYYSRAQGKLWRSDGTNAGTFALITTADPSDSYNSNPMRVSASGTIVYWYDPSGPSILQSDGTVAGTHKTSVNIAADNTGTVAGGFVMTYADFMTNNVDVYLFDFITRTVSVVASFAGMDAGRGASYQDGTSKLYFPIHSWGVGNYMAVTDGTGAGTSMLENIVMMDSTLRPVGKLGSNVIFVGQPTAAGGGTFRFYATQGTGMGDWNLLADTGLSFTGPNWYDWNVDFSIQLGSRLIVRFFEYNHRSTASFCPIWMTDGTPGGTIQYSAVAIKDPATSAFYWGSNLQPFVYDGTVFFQGYDAAHGVELWTLDGNNPPALFADLNSGAGNGIPLVSNVNTAYYAAVTSTFFALPIQTASNGIEPFVSDGTPAGTMMAQDILPGSRSSLGGSSGYDFQFFSVNNKVVFSANEDNDGTEFWVTDGTPSGTTILASLNSSPGNSQMSLLQVLNGKIYFAANDGTTGVEPWVSDGTEAGTGILADIDSTSFTSRPSQFVNYNGDTYFLAIADNSLADDKTSLWKTDGTQAGTVEISHQKILQYSPIVGTTNGMFMIGYDGNGQEPWISNGTGAGTVMLADLAAGASSTFDWGADWFLTWNSKFFFAPNRWGTLDNEPWVSDGTAPGTTQLGSFNAGNNGSFPTRSMGTSQYLFFAAWDATAGRELFKTDGAGTTSLVKDINPTGHSFISNAENFFGTVNDKLIFTANDGTNGTELWVSDGSAAGTFMLQDISPGALDTAVRAAAQDSNSVYLLIQPDGGNYELWKTDGTIAETVKIHTFAAGESPSSNTVDMLATGSYVFFTMCEATHGCELWRSDLTDAGTSLFWDASSGLLDTDPRSFVLYYGRLYFIGHYEGGGEALWAVDPANGP